MFLPVCQFVDVSAYEQLWLLCLYQFTSLWISQATNYSGYVSTSLSVCLCLSLQTTLVMFLPVCQFVDVSAFELLWLCLYQLMSQPTNYSAKCRNDTTT